MHRTIARGAAPRRGGAQNFRWQTLWTWRWARTLAVLGGPVKKGPACWARKPRGGDFRKVARRGALGDLQGVKGCVYILFGVQGKMDLGMPDLRTAAD